MSTKIVSAVVAALALAATVSPSKAQSAAELYPYCAFRSGSTSCYHMTLETCGHSCIRNPAYVGDERAPALRTALAGPTPARERVTGLRRAKAGFTPAFASVPGAAAGHGAGGGLAWTASDRINRSGDFQAQGRF